MGEHFRPPYNGKFYITDRDGRQIEFKADFISEINISQEIEREPIAVLENAMRTFSQASKKLTLSMTIIKTVEICTAVMEEFKKLETSKEDKKASKKGETK